MEEVEVVEEMVEEAVEAVEEVVIVEVVVVMEVTKTKEVVVWVDLVVHEMDNKITVMEVVGEAMINKEDKTNKSK